MRYTHSPNIWQLTEQQIKHLQPGQWVYAGDPGSKGQFLGVKPSGTVVVAWLGNIRNHRGQCRSYLNKLRQYALGG
jgi:hypothetical protein